MARVEPVNKILHLPNMVLSTTYAMNRSDSKRLTVGLEYSGGFFKPTVKLGGIGSPSKYVTLDKTSWEILLTHTEAMESYLHNDYRFTQDLGNPGRIYLPAHDIQLTDSFGCRAIMINERPISIPPNNLIVETQDKPSVSVLDTILEPPSKKKKMEQPPGITMQMATFEGFKSIRECVNLRLLQLEKQAVMVNNSFDFILNFLKQKLNTENPEKVKSLLKDYSAFKQFYAVFQNDMIQEFKIHSDYAMFHEEFLNIILAEINGFILPIIIKDLQQILLPA